jgi:DNA-3-methyladenine glycosylase
MVIEEFLERPAPPVAPELIGWRLQVNGITGTIAETEAYYGEDDLACHASKGRTPRTATLYAQPGTIYVYLCYGIHWMLNLECDREGVPSAVLVRGLLIDGIDAKRSNGCRRAEAAAARMLLSLWPQ